jgi:hypothetical protein
LSVASRVTWQPVSAPAPICSRLERRLGPKLSAVSATRWPTRAGR